MTEEELKEEMEAVRESAGNFVNALQRAKELGINIKAKFYREGDRGISFIADFDKSSTLSSIELVAHKHIEL